MRTMSNTSCQPVSGVCSMNGTSIPRPTWARRIAWVMVSYLIVTFDGGEPRVAGSRSNRRASAQGVEGGIERVEPAQAVLVLQLGQNGSDATVTVPAHDSHLSLNASAWLGFLNRNITRHWPISDTL
jgi:hypothetical protein